MPRLSVDIDLAYIPVDERDTALENISNGLTRIRIALEELFGGKICAALDCQHPRDLFDVRLLLDNEGFAEEIKIGFLMALISHMRPINEVFNPSFIDQCQAFETQFSGMTSIPFTYIDYEHTRQ